RVVPEDEMVEALLSEARLLVEHGAEARLAAADAGAAAEAEKDRAELLAVQGEDANASEAAVELIRKSLDGR
ncbi:MAG: flavodoxin-dependent (E)-4-hydroxy-3-methylbut-2-enyl-diphosphate synthase, partial [Acidimicrobiales bacterium]